MDLDGRKPVEELDTRFSSAGASPTPWPKARERLSEGWSAHDVICATTLSVRTIARLAKLITDPEEFDGLAFSPCI